jgi:hypothetical protein
MESLELNQNEPCGCGSGIAYGKCHQKTPKKYYRNNDGDVFLRQKLNDQSKALLEEVRVSFTRDFGREPLDSEPVFVDGDLIFPGRYNELFKEIAEIAGTPPEVVHAMLRTGLTIAEENFHMFSPSEIKEWKNAQRQFHAARKKGYDPNYLFTYLSGREYEFLKQLILRIKIVSSLLRISCKRIQETREQKQLNFNDTVFLLTLDSVAVTANNIVRLFEKRFTNDMLSIVRGIYESYLKISCMRNKYVSGEQIILSSLATRGIVEYKKKANGKFDYDFVTKADGNFVKAIPSYKKLSENTNDPQEEWRYNYLYKLCSSRVHLDIIDSYVRSIKSQSIGCHDDEDKPYCFFIAGYIMMIFLKELMFYDIGDSQLKLDAAYQGEVLADILDRIGENKKLRQKMPFFPL